MGIYNLAKSKRCISEPYKGIGFKDDMQTSSVRVSTGCEKSDYCKDWMHI